MVVWRNEMRQCSVSMHALCHVLALVDVNLFDLIYDWALERELYIWSTWYRRLN